MTPRLFVPGPLTAGQRLALPVAATRHVQVLRLQPGQPVRLFDGEADAEWPAQIVAMGKRSVEVDVGAPLPVDRELALRVGLAIGMPANERMDALVEKSVELGAAAIDPLVCARSVVRLAGERAEARQRHWARIAEAACEQCGRVRVPRVGLPLKLDAWLRRFDPGAAGPAPAPVRIVLSFDRDAVAPAALDLPRRAAAAPAQAGAAHPARLGAAAQLDVVVLSGPEGGLAPDEEAAAVARGFVGVWLGPRVLRADTAPLAWLAWLAGSAAGERRAARPGKEGRA